MNNFKILLFGSGSSRVSLLLQFYKYLKSKKLIKISYLVLIYLERTYGVYIQNKARIGRNLKFPHPTSIVIGAGVDIGNNVTIYQNVTLGGARNGDAKLNNYPKIGDGTIIFSGAVVIGGIKIGDNCIIGANSVVNKDIPPNHIAYGVPCKFKKKLNEV